MRAGKLDKRITIQRATQTQLPSGEPISSWGDLVSNRPASLDSLNGMERFSGEQLVAKTQFVFTIRWSSEVDDVGPLDRIIYPASALLNSPTDPLKNKIYDIFAVTPIGRKEGIKLFATVRQDETS